MHNASERVIDQVLFPSDLLITKADLHQALLPTLPGVLLEQPFFAKRARYDALYPSWQGLFADYVALQMKESSLTLNTIEQPTALESAKVSLINEPDVTRLVHTFYPYIPRNSYKRAINADARWLGSPRRPSALWAALCHHDRRLSS